MLTQPIPKFDRLADRDHFVRQAMPIILLVFGVLSSAEAADRQPCRILIVDASNGWPVPMVELETTHHVRFVSDNAGVIAMDAPELMEKETWFSVRAHGYSVPKDGFGNAGVRLTPRPGETLTVQVNRQLAAKRLGRLTGIGLFAESQKLGEQTQWRDQDIAGCDSVQNAIFGGKLHWGWGDTTLLRYPLGRFHMTGATTTLQPLESFQPPLQLRFDYVTDDSGRSRDVGKMSGDGPSWLFGYVSLPDQNGKQRLGATYSKIRPPLTEYEKGLCVWNEETRTFEQFKVIWKQSKEQPEPPPMPHGHAITWSDAAGQSWVLFGDPFPTLQCPATFESWSSPETWQHLEPQADVPVLDKATGDAAQRVKPHRGAIAWNQFRNKYVTIFTQYGGDASMLGELWYAESDSPRGPWQEAIKVVTHDNYTFYNPQLHPEFVDAGSPVLLFEATYTAMFSDAKSQTPRYDYNQILYRLDLERWPWQDPESTPQSD